MDYIYGLYIWIIKYNGVISKNHMGVVPYPGTISQKQGVITTEITQCFNTIKMQFDGVTFTTAFLQSILEFNI